MLPKQRQSQSELTKKIDTACARTLVVLSQVKKLKSQVRALRSEDVLVLMCTVLLQAMKVEPPVDAKCRDKFLVQSVAVTADKEFTNIAAIVRPPHLNTLNNANSNSGNMWMTQIVPRYKRRRSELSTFPLEIAQ
jgi:hypothetical protein